MSHAAASAIAGILLAGAVVVAQSEEAARIRDAVTVLDEIMSAPDRAIPESVLERADGIAVFPGVLKGAFVIGAERGRGILSAREPKSDTWSAPAFLTITGGSVGFQIGAQSADLVLVVMNQRGLQNLVRNQFKIGAGVSVAAGPVGRVAEAATDIQMRAEILSYSRTRGLFAGVDLKGASIRQDADANERFYGRRYTTRDLAFERLGGAPDPVALWRDTLAKYFRPGPS
jgi:lipid-binding SYLF domain-containing protein